MASIGTFGSFAQARLGIYASYAGLTVTGNNISNINTEGYTRQKLDQTSFYAGGSDRYYSQYDIRVGNGVLATGVSQLRDPYLDIRYRNEMADVGYMDAKMAGLEDVQRILDEVGDGDDAFGILGAQFNDILDKLEKLSDQTGQEQYDIGVRASAEALVNIFHSYASQLETAYDNSVTSFQQNVRTVNEILTNIRDLNDSIKRADIHGDNALELRDQRNELIDELSSYMKINAVYTEEDLGGGLIVEKLTIRLDDPNPDPTITTDESILVDGSYATQLTMPEKIKQPVFYRVDENGDYDANGTIKVGADGKPLYVKNDPTAVPGTPPTETTNMADALLEEVENTNFTISLDPLKDSKGRTQYTTEKGAFNGNVSEIDYNTATDSGKNTTVTKPEVDANGNETGNTIITIYGKVKKMVPQEDPDNPGKYLDAEGNTVDDVTKAAKVEQITYTSQEYIRKPSQAIQLHDNDLYGSLQAQRELLTEEGEFASLEDIALDPNAATKRGIGFYQKSLDLLANQFAKVFNEANTPPETREYLYETYIGADGQEYYKLDETSPFKGKTASYISTVDGTQKELRYDAVNLPDDVPEDTKAWFEAAQEIFLPTDPDSPNDVHGFRVEEVGGNLFSNSSDSDDGTGITASNISISASWAEGPLIVNSFKSYGDLGVGSTDSENINHMISLINKSFTYNPQDVAEDAVSSDIFEGSFGEMWDNIGSILGNDMLSTGTMSDIHYAKAVDLDSSRDSVSSVDLNDEAMNLMQYSKSYNAACRLMTTIDSILDKLINGTGITG